jgi:hypothetical protein
MNSKSFYVSELDDPIGFMLFVKHNPKKIENVCTYSLQQSQTTYYGHQQFFEFDPFLNQIIINEHNLREVISTVITNIMGDMLLPYAREQIIKEMTGMSFQDRMYYDQANALSSRIDVDASQEHIFRRVAQIKHDLIFKINGFYGRDYLQRVLGRKLIKLLKPELERANNENHYRDKYTYCNNKRW